MAKTLWLFGFILAFIGVCRCDSDDKKDVEKIELSKDVKWKRLEFAVEDAEQDNKMVLVFIGKSWCKPCHKLAKDLYDNEEFKELSKQFHMAAAIDDNAPIGEMYDIDGKYAPKIIFQDSKGNVLRGITNGKGKTRYFYKKADQVIVSMKEALAKTSVDQGFGKDYNWKNYADGLVEAKKSGKPMLVLLHQDWCSSCQRLKPKIAASKELVEASKDFIMVNTEDEEVVKKKEFDIDGVYYPRIFFLDDNGEVLKEQWNLDTEHKHVKYYYGEPEDLIKAMKRVVEHMSQVKISLDRGMGKHIDWKTYQEGLAIAKEQKKPMMLIIHKSYCGACKALKPKIRASEELGELSKRFVMVNTIDDEEPNEAQYDVDGAYIPRVFFVDSNGVAEPSVRNEREEFKKYRYAYSDAEQLIENMKKALEMNLGERKQQVVADLSDQISWFSLEEGLKEAKKSHRAAMLFFHNSWCSFSKEFLKIMRESSDIKRLSEKFVMISSEDDNASADKKYDIDGTYTPRVLFLDNNGNVQSDINNTDTEYPLTKFYYKTADEIITSMKLAIDAINVSIARGFGDYINWQTLPKGKEIAKQQNKPIMVIIHRTWCSACKALKPKFAESYDIYELSKNFVMVNVEDDEEPEDTQFLVDGGYYPRIMFLEPNGNVVKELHNDDQMFLKYKFSYNDADGIVRVMRKATKMFTESGNLPAAAIHATAGDGIPWISYEEGLKQAKESKKPIFLLIHRSSCPACKAVHRMLVREENFIAKIKDFIMVEIEDDIHTEIAAKYDVDGQYVPRIYFIDPNGETLKKIWNVGTQYQENKFYYYETISVIRAMDKALKKVSGISNEKTDAKKEDGVQKSKEEIKKDEL